ncbi:MAG: extracellular solute-binding protein, partial [Oscillospiraceae bacterium]|nr:extracellular solute-binding protein [Oscillospiraceae bacterium]
TLNLSESWWNQTMDKEAAVGAGNKLYYAGCGIDIMTLQCVSCVYFNQDMMTNLGLDLPYNTVRNGKWTFDAFNQYQKAGANLNGDASFNWTADGAAIWGFVGYDDAATALLEGSGERLITTDANGTPALSIEGERFINVLGKIQTMLQPQDGEFMYANNSANGDIYEQIFKNGRALMTMGELKAADVFRDMNVTFGIPPIPKYDENQANYYCHLIIQTPVLVIPATNPNPELTGAVVDAMAYLSNSDVTPVLFNVAVSQKQLRNDDSIDMLQIIKNSGSFDVGCAYGWTNVFYDKIRSTIGFGKPLDIAAEIEKDKDTINANIDKTMEVFQ